MQSVTWPSIYSTLYNVHVHCTVQYFLISFYVFGEEWYMSQRRSLARYHAWTLLFYSTIIRSKFHLTTMQRRVINCSLWFNNFCVWQFMSCNYIFSASISPLCCIFSFNVMHPPGQDGMPRKRLRKKTWEIETKKERHTWTAVRRIDKI